MNNVPVTSVGVFSDADSLAAAVKNLVKRGHDDVEALSPIPLPELEEVLPQPPSPVRWFTLAGCIAGAFLGMGLQVYTVLDWPLLTGGKPIISIPAFVVIAFEMTILFGAFGTMAGLLLAANLPPIEKKFYHEGCSRSDFAVLVVHAPSDSDSVCAVLKDAGAHRVDSVKSGEVGSEPHNE